MANRKFKDNGLEPVLGYLFMLAGFVALSMYLFYKTRFAQYAYILISLAITQQFSEMRRNDFLKICFGNRRYIWVRIIENLAAAFPFVIFMLCKQLFAAALLLLAATLLLCFSSTKKKFHFTIPTPFYQHPFEFPVGFRNAFFIFPLAYVLTIIAIVTNNFNLGIFAMLLIFFVVIGFYTKPENEYFVWSFAAPPQRFLMQKIKTAFIYTSILCVPVVLPLGFCYVTEIGYLLLFYFVGCIMLMTIIFAKYSAYPNEMNLPEGIVLALCISFPPLLLIFAPYFYTKAVKQLETFPL